MHFFFLLSVSFRCSLLVVFAQGVRFVCFFCFFILIVNSKVLPAQKLKLMAEERGEEEREKLTTVMSKSATTSEIKNESAIRTYLRTLRIRSQFTKRSCTKYGIKIRRKKKTLIVPHVVMYWHTGFNSYVISIWDLRFSRDTHSQCSAFRRIESTIERN